MPKKVIYGIDHPIEQTIRIKQKLPSLKVKKTKSQIEKDYRARLKKSLFEALGLVCVNCGFSDSRALQVDHINGGGSKERKEKGNGTIFYKKALESFLANENKYQLLCANCNWIKRYTHNELQKCL